MGSAICQVIGLTFTHGSQPYIIDFNPPCLLYLLIFECLEECKEIDALFYRKIGGQLSNATHPGDANTEDLPLLSLFLNEICRRFSVFISEPNYCLLASCRIG